MAFTSAAAMAKHVEESMAQARDEYSTRTMHPPTQNTGARAESHSHPRPDHMQPQSSSLPPEIQRQPDDPSYRPDKRLRQSNGTPAAIGAKETNHLQHQSPATPVPVTPSGGRARNAATPSVPSGDRVIQITNTSPSFSTPSSRHSQIYNGRSIAPYPEPQAQRISAAIQGPTTQYMPPGQGYGPVHSQTSQTFSQGSLNPENQQSMPSPMVSHLQRAGVSPSTVSCSPSGATATVHGLYNIAGPAHPGITCHPSMASTDPNALASMRAHINSLEAQIIGLRPQIAPANNQVDLVQLAATTAQLQRLNDFQQEENEKLRRGNKTEAQQWLQMIQRNERDMNNARNEVSKLQAEKAELKQKLETQAKVHSEPPGTVLVVGKEVHAKLVVLVAEFLRLEDACKSLPAGSTKRPNCVAKIVAKKMAMRELLHSAEAGTENLSEEEMEKAIAEPKNQSVEPEERTKEREAKITKLKMPTKKSQNKLEEMMEQEELKDEISELKNAAKSKEEEIDRLKKLCNSQRFRLTAYEESD